MASRRCFLQVFGLLGVASLGETAAAPRRMRCRRSSFSASQTVDASNSLTAATKEPEFIQPEYAKWLQVKIGMHRDEVLTLLGEPLYRQDNDPRLSDSFLYPKSPEMSKFSYYWDYGYLRFRDSTVPDAFDFSIFFQFITQKVNGIYDPFSGRFSNDGVPTVPRLVLPHDGSKWSHNPRFLDLRWEPSAGVYPIQYEIESACAQYDPRAYAMTYPSDETETSDVPHHAIAFGGAQKGRWRVRAQNRLGRSEWSEFRYFEFTA